MHRFIQILFVAILFFSCEEQVEKHEYYSFEKQISPSGKYIIYHYGRFGAFATSSDIIGTELFKVDEAFAEGKGEKISGQISEWISDDTLLVYNFNTDAGQPKDTLPIKLEYSQHGDFIVKTIYYDLNSGSRAIYDFDSVATTDDSIYIQVLPEGQEKRILGFPLGGTRIKIKSDSINHLEVSYRLYKRMDFVYKNPDGTFKSGLPHIGSTYYDLTPSKRISPEGLNKRKIFYEK